MNKDDSDMINKTFDLSPDYPGATLTTYVLDNPADLNLSPRRAVIVCPGGGYRFLSNREAEPIVTQFLAANMNVFLLRYTVGPKTDGNAGASGYAPLIEAGLAIKYVREHAEEYGTIPDKIFILGFSAGGHVAASAGTLWNIPEVRDAIGVSSGKCPEGINRPDGTVLCYPVITGGEKAHKGSVKNFIGHDELTEEDIERFSLERHVDDGTSPAFMWHTASDATVPVENSLMYASALSAHKIPFELHIFPAGKHGLSLCNEFTCSQKADAIVPHAEVWIDLAVKWVKEF